MENRFLRLLTPIVNRSKFFVFFLFIVILSFNNAWAHPHVFITSKITLEFDEEGPSGILVNWSFDEFFSAMIAGDFDSNRNGRFDKSEIKALYNGAFINLKNFNYFTTIKIDDRDFTVDRVTRFNASLKNRKMGYSFFIPFKREAKEIIFSQFDSTYYTDIDLKADVRSRNNNFSIKSTLYKNMNKSFYNGLVNPYELKIGITRKK